MSSVCELLFSVLVFACSTTLLIEEAASGMQTTDPEVRFGRLRIIRRLSFGAGIGAARCGDFLGIFVETFMVSRVFTGHLPAKACRPKSFRKSLIAS